MLASERRAFVVAFVLVLTFNLYWYGAFLSFPVLGEDGGALFSNLLETIRDRHFLTIHFPIAWLDGLGQPNFFITFTFDPFAWVMLLPIEPADAYRISMALRATTAWLTSYWFVLVLFRSRRQVALLSATLYLLIGFTLTSAWGIPTYAGMFNATATALFPLLPAMALLVMRRKRIFGAADLGLFVTLLFFLLDYPVGSLIGIAVFLAFAVMAALDARPAERRAARWGIAKIVAMLALLLLAPPLEMLSSWSAAVGDTARLVFADELFAYGNSHVPPLMWTRTVPALRVCILAAVAVLLFNRRWPRPLRMAAATLALVVGGVQLAFLLRYLGLDAGLVDRLPRLHYFEFYTPLFYATCGGFALYNWHDLLFPRLEDRHSLWSWAARLAIFVAIALFSLPFGAVVALSYGFFAVLARLRGARADGGWTHSSLWRRFAARSALVALVVLAIAAWLPPSAETYPLFFVYARCREGVLWCRDPMGPTVGMSDNPISRYLRSELSGSERYAGRAETLVRPPVRFERVGAGEVRFTSQLFDRLHGWYERAYEALVVKPAPGSDPFSVPPAQMGWAERYPLLVALDKLGRNDVRFHGPSQERLVLEMYDWYGKEGASYDLVAPNLLDPWGAARSVEAAVDERNQAYFATGNGMVQRALPFQGVPVASSYEDNLGYLYYLLWTRYVSAGQPATKSINMTTLEALHPERLALVGVRYVVARDSEAYERPLLERVMGWHGYSVYAVRDPNLAGYAVHELTFGDSLAEELKLMRRHGFQPRLTAVLPASERGSFLGPASRGLGTLAGASVRLTPDELTYAARSEGGESFVVLPFDWSHCWRPEWRKGQGRILRADAGLVGVAFAGEVELRLRWTARYGGESACLRADQELAAEAKRAAAAVSFAQAYEPLDGDFRPFASARPRFAADLVEETALERTALYQSGDEVVVPADAAKLLSADELAARRWTTSVSSQFGQDAEGYEFLGRNDGGASLVVLPLAYSSCWQARWQAGEGTLVPVDARWFGVLFRGAVSLRLSLLPDAARAGCAQIDRTRARLAELLEAAGARVVGARYSLGKTIEFRTGGGSELFTTEGWWYAEPWGRWSRAKARLVLRLAAPPAGDLELDASMLAFVPPKRARLEATVRVNGAPVALWEVPPAGKPVRERALVPRELVGDTGVAVIDFEVDGAVSPKELGLSLDDRQLALGFESLTLKPAGAP
ncbi:MAG: hypothetical protein ACHQRJ_02075 [Alphaproteobacteria bacterium]